MHAKTKALILGSSALAIAAAAVIGAALWPREPASAGRTPHASASTAPMTHTASHARQWISGTTYVYEIENARTITVQGDGAAGPPRALGLSGRLSISVVGPSEDADDGISLRLVLDEARPGAGAAFPFDVSQLSSPFYAIAAPTGRLASFSFARALDGNARATLKLLASALQVVVPEPAAAAWRATEQDASGEYEAAYSATGDAVHKIKDRFLRVRGPRGLQPVEDPAAYQVASSADFTLDASGWPRLASEDESVTVATQSMRLVATSKTSARLVSIEQAPDLAARASTERAALEPEPEADPAGFATAKRRADESLVDGASLPALLADLASGDARLRNRTMARMAALLRLHPGEALQAAASVLRGGLGEETAKRLIGALGGAGTAEAQRALSSIITAERAPADTRDDAAAALGMTRNPTDDTARTLAEATRSSDPALASTATLGLGNAIKRMNEQGSGDPSSALALLIERLQRATDDAERILCLEALGNSGDPAGLPAIEPYLSAAATDVRAAAVGALRFLPSASDHVVAALSDLAPTVRRAAAGALTYRAITPLLSAVTAMLEHDPDTSTRLELVSALRLRKRQEPALVALLTWAAEHDPAPEVRRAAKGAASM